MHISSLVFGPYIGLIYGIMYLMESRVVKWIVRAFGRKDASPTPIQDKEEKPPPPSSIQVYFEKNHAQWKKSFENSDVNWNANISPVMYTRGRELQEIVESSRDNELEIAWRRRVLMETTPRGNIMMYYDIFLDLFVTFSDESMIPFDILNAAAMRYTLMFRCRDFFNDEKYLPVVPNKYMECKEKEKTMIGETKTKQSNNRPLFLDDKSAPFLIPKRPKAPTITATRKIEDEKKKEQVGNNINMKYVNRFKYMGKFANYSLLQKIHKPRSTKIIPCYHDEEKEEDAEEEEEPKATTIPVDNMTYAQYTRYMMEQCKREQEVASMLAKLTIHPDSN